MALGETIIRLPKLAGMLALSRDYAGAKLSAAEADSSFAKVKQSRPSDR
jgi:hypothetical protein